MKTLLGVLVGFAVVACGDDSTCEQASNCQNTGGGLVAGAGGESSGGNAAGAGEPGGASSNGGEGAGGSAPTATTIYVESDNGAWIKDLEVIVNAPDGELLFEELTDINGAVTVMVPPGGSVSLLREYDMTWLDPIQKQRSVETVFFDDSPSGTIRFMIRQPIAPYEPPNGVMNLTVSYPTKAGAADYLVKTSCGQQSTSSTQVTLTVASCTPNGLFDILVVARNAAGDIVDHAHAESLVFAAGTVNSPLTWATLPLTAIDFSLSNVPAEALQITANTIAKQEQGGRTITALTQRFVADPMSEYAASLAHLTSYGSEHCQQATVDLVSDANALAYISKLRCTQTADVSDFALDASRLERFDVLPPSPDGQVMHWETSSAGEAGDLLTIRQYWTRNGDIGTWTAFKAPGAGEAVFPALPPPFADFGIGAKDSLVQSSVIHEDDVELEGFEQALAAGVPFGGLGDVEGYTSHAY